MTTKSGAPCLFLLLSLLVVASCGRATAPSPVSPAAENKPVQSAPSAGADTKVPEDTDDVSGVAVGRKAPDFDVEILGGETLTLSSLFGDGQPPTVLLFDRAHW